MEELLRATLENGEISGNLSKAYITLIPKDSGPQNNMKNYRPISLLNIEYKMITKALTNKVTPYLETLIHTDQAVAIKGRNIQNHNHLIRDLITLAHDRQDSNLILSIDQEKAFDRVSHDWMIRVIEKCNFGPNFTKWIRILYSNPTSHILVNHTLSEAFELGRGVRQGDPLSMMLYVLSLEPLLESIRLDNNITGIKIPGQGTQKLLAFADDTNFFPSNTASIQHTIDHFKSFGRASGTKINTNKSKAMGLGKWGNFADIEGIQWVEEIKLFGITYTKDRNQKCTKLWDKILNDIKTLADRYFLKEATIFGRAIIVNTLLEPKFLYLTHTQDPPRKILQKYNHIIRTYLLRGTITRIRQNTLTQDKLNGGVNLHNMEAKIHSLRLKHFHSYLQTGNPITDYYLGLHIRQYKKFENNKPHFTGRLPKFQNNLLSLVKKTHQYWHSAHQKNSIKC